MHTMTLKVDESVYAKLMTVLELFPKSKVKIEHQQGKTPNKKTIKAIEDLEADRNCERFQNTKEMFEAYGV